MTENITKGETHGCIVCGKLYQLLIAYDVNGKYIDSKVMSAGGREVRDSTRPLVACEIHTEDEIERAVKRVFGQQESEDD